MSIREELTAAVRERGVRVDERLELLRLMDAEDGAPELERRIAALRERIRKAAGQVRGSIG